MRSPLPTVHTARRARPCPRWWCRRRIQPGDLVGRVLDGDGRRVEQCARCCWADGSPITQHDEDDIDRRLAEAGLAPRPRVGQVWVSTRFVRTLSFAEVIGFGNTVNGWMVRIARWDEDDTGRVQPYDGTFSIFVHLFTDPDMFGYELVGPVEWEWGIRRWLAPGHEVVHRLGAGVTESAARRVPLAGLDVLVRRQRGFAEWVPVLCRFCRTRTGSHRTWSGIPGEVSACAPHNPYSPVRSDCA